MKQRLALDPVADAKPSKKEHRELRRLARSGNTYPWPLNGEPRRPLKVPTAHLNRTTHPLSWVNAASTPAYLLPAPASQGSLGFLAPPIRKTPRNPCPYLIHIGGPCAGCQVDE